MSTLLDYDDLCQRYGLSRRFIGIELDPEYFAIAKQRIESAYEN